MKIDAMVKRENFYSINEKTLEDYYKFVHGIKLKVKTSNYSLLRKVFIYPKINAIVTRKPSSSVIKYLMAEFNVRTSIIKFILGKIYTFACLYSGGVLSSKALVFSEYNPMTDSILVLPCNRKIRIIDFDNQHVDSIIKEGFTRKYFVNELSFRQKSKYPFVPPILLNGESWYREPLLRGQPLARVSDGNQYALSSEMAIDHIGVIGRDTLHFVGSEQYARKLLNLIKVLIPLAKKNKHIQHGQVLLDVSEHAFSTTIQLPDTIPTAMTHGDFQSGNIWVDPVENKTFLIDWETAAVRSIWYDPATLLLSTRRHNGVINMVATCESQHVQDSVLINDSNKRYNMMAVMGILLLEDIIFYLEDNLELPEDWGGDLIDKYASQLKNIKW